ncbi:tyrosine-type recombinase/integrase [Micromonospora sp. NPDC049101]|uniref:tyrosine-type recombinase/integrase n=1 Tax=Micromonospora sp. NPDC049101 TaxID=3155032 RepID=UPI0033EDFBAB
MTEVRTLAGRAVVCSARPRVEGRAGWPTATTHLPRRANGAPAFTTRFAGPYRHDYYGSLIFSAAVERAGLPKGTTSHDLRHHYASVLLMQGESVIVVAERLGHENATLVLSTYGHLVPDSEERTRRAVDDAWGCAPDVPQGDVSTV